jgi:hypothetical protein
MATDWRDQLFSETAVNDGDLPHSVKRDPDAAPLLEGDVAEKILQVLFYLQSIEDYDAVTYQECLDDVGVNLWQDTELLARLESENNPNVHIDTQSETLNYVTAVGVTKREDLEAQLQKYTGGLLLNDLKEESYEGVEYDVAKLVHDGKVLAVNGRRADKTLLYPRIKQNLLVELPGRVDVAHGSRFLRTELDLRDFIRRGDLILVGGSEPGLGSRFRVSTAGLEDVHANWECQLNAASSSVPHTATIPGRRFPFTSSILPLDDVYSGPTLKGARVEKFGCTTLHRRVWSELEKERSNPCENQNKDRHGTLTSSIEKCRDMGILSRYSKGNEEEVDNVLSVALGSTGALESRRKKEPKGKKRKRMRLAPRKGGKHKKGKKDTAHLRGDPKYAALMATMDSY